MKSSTKLSLLALGLLVPAISIPMFVQAANGSSNSALNNSQTNKKGAMLGNHVPGRNLTTEQRTQLMAERDTRRDAVAKAISARDYSAWVTAVGKDSPMAKQVSSDEFATFIEAHNLMMQAQEKMKSIGVEQMGKNGHVGFGKMLAK